MFFTETLTHDVLLHPRFLDQNLEAILKTQLYSEVECKVHRSHGYVLAVIKIDRISEGRILFNRGEILFNVTYTAVILRPVPKQVIDTMVTSVNNRGIFVSIGPLTAFVSNSWIPDMTFDSDANPPRYISAKDGITIEPNDGVRVKIIAVRIAAQDIFITASLTGDYLGPSDARV
ncbi:uncharacterized protein MONBRDRAFT_31260 [Monosiga brevicollis MX1]|uniref:S1 motif domain-containing protein n=1 Tax=Monosiga brevicollis TaxID=81824 RepID=A9USP9_MONBE|nr:uncharacterized protein MONBRDRAFT_31260 [Monosiga brevicollis MX1]EDQ91817.1 predicted protein [Monosiga brevicollis MX1]|eukprot:XP_001743103.1 hypothetical protein [Monosiga brevicollis MX1]